MATARTRSARCPINDARNYAHRNRCDAYVVMTVDENGHRFAMTWRASAAEAETVRAELAARNVGRNDFDGILPATVAVIIETV